MMMDSGVKSAKDSGWAWVVCAAAFCDVFVVLGVQYTFGVLFVALLDHFKDSKSNTGVMPTGYGKTLLFELIPIFSKLYHKNPLPLMPIIISPLNAIIMQQNACLGDDSCILKKTWVGSIGQFCLYFLAYVSSILCDVFGCRLMTIIGGLLMSLGLLLSSFSSSIRLLYFTHGVLLGIGSSLCYLPALVMVALYFEKRRSLATAIAASGGNIGALVLAPLQQVIVETWGWRNCYRFLAGFSLITVLCGVLFKPLPATGETSEEIFCEESETTNSSAEVIHLRETTPHWCRLGPRFIIWALAGTIACFGYFMPHVHLVRLAEELGSTFYQGSLLLTYMSATSAIGKLIFGKISDLKCINTLVLYQVCMGLTSLTSIICITATAYKMLVIYAVTIGILDGSFIGLMSIVTFECCDHNNLSRAWGGVLMCMSLSMLVGAPAGSWLGEQTGRYRNVFFLAGGPMLLGTVLFTFIWFFKQPVRSPSLTSKRSVYLPGSDGEIFVYEKLTVV